MHLSRLTLNTANPAALHALADSYALHQLVLSAFPDREEGGPGRVLYRVEPDAMGRPPEVLVQSERKPGWQELERRALLAAECRMFSPRLQCGQRLRFRVRANPTLRCVFEPAPRPVPRRPGGNLTGESAYRVS